MGVSGFILARVATIVVVFVAIGVGWVMNCEIPEGRFFATVLPLTKGVLPPTIVGHGKMEGTPAVPDDMQPQPRPSGETFLTLPGNYTMPQNGLGLCCRPTAYDDVLVRRTVAWFLLQGGRLLDTADLYLNHEGVGHGISDAVAKGVPREEIFLTTKIYPTHYGYNKTLEAVPRYLKELNVDYIDLVLMHAPVRLLGGFGDGCKGLTTIRCRQDTWRALSVLRNKGLVRNVGVSNLAVHHLQQLEELIESEADIAPIANNQIGFNPWSPQAWVDSFEYCQKKNISVTCYNSLGGLFQKAEANTAEVLQGIAKKHNRSIAQIMLRWALHMNAGVIPGTGNPKHMRENLSIYEFELSPEDIKAIDVLRNDESAKKFMAMPVFD